MTTKEHAAAIRADYKRHGWSSRDISVQSDSFSLGSSITVRIKNPNVSISVAKALAERHEVVRRDERTGDILGGGNRYVSVSYSHEAAQAIQEKYADVLNAAAQALQADPNDNSLHSIAGTPFLLGRGCNGFGYSLWQDGHITEANEAKYLATTIHGRL